MIVIRHATAGQFLKRAGSWLETSETENNMILGIASGLQKHPEACKSEPHFLTIEDNGAVVGSAVMAPPHHLVITRSSENAIETTTHWLLKEQVSLPGVLGPEAEAQCFANYWGGTTGKFPYLGFALRLHSCSSVMHPPHNGGQLRAASIADTALLIQWCREFIVATGVPESADDCDELVPKRIADKTLYVWEDEQVVSMAGLGGDTAHGIRLGSVYTPPNFRGRGYATSCVAALTQRMLDTGKSFCCLYTDLANPTSNNIYQKIGYHPVCDWHDWFFEKKD
jgi:predicted GNAT family acetyltransferase